MYDTINSYLSNDEVKNTNFLEVLPAFLTKVTSQGNTEAGMFVNGYLGSLKTTITAQKITIRDSSLSKFYLGDNLQTLSKGDTMKAFQQISDLLHVPFEKARISRIDLAQNIILKNPIDDYFSFLGESQHYKRLEQNNGLYFSNRLRVLAFYEKLQEQTIKGKSIPEIYQNRNLLRYELRFRKRLPQQFNQPVIRAFDLYNERFYYNIVKRWKNEYLQIQKINSKLYSMKPTGSKKEFIENLALFSILDLGQTRVLKMIQQWLHEGQITKKQAFDLRKSIKDISKVKTTSNQNELLQELTKKIKESARFV